MRIAISGIAISCAFGAAIFAQPTVSDVIGAGISGDAVGSQDGKPYTTVRFKIAPDWVEVQQWSPQGSLGDSLSIYSLGTEARSIWFDARGRGGGITDEFAKTGGVANEDLVSPTSWIRAIQISREKGTLLEGGDDGMQWFEFPSLRDKLTMRVWAKDKTIPKVEYYMPGKTGPRKLLMTYTDWVEGPTGMSPRRSTLEFTGLTGQPAVIETRITNLERLADPTKLPEGKLPLDARLKDYTLGKMVDGEGKIIGELPNFAANAAKPWWRQQSTFLISAIAVLGLAGFIWRKVRKT